MTSKEFLKIVENFIQVFIASWIIVYASFRIMSDPNSVGDWMMLGAGAFIVFYANWSYRRRRAAKENQQ